MATETFRLGMFIDLRKRGATKEVAAKGAVAVFFRDDAFPPGEPFRRALRKPGRRLARASRKAPVEQLEALFDAALHELEELAIVHGEAHYAGVAREFLEGRNVKEVDGA